MDTTQILLTMKSLLCLLFLGISIVSYGQEFQPIVKPDTTIWYIAHQQLAGQFLDTLFAKNEVDGWTELWFQGAYYYGEMQYVGKTKTSVNNDSVWFIAAEDSIEMLLFDLNLNQGDTFKHAGYIVDTVYIEDERKHIVFQNDSHWDEPIKFIEGVGPNLSFMGAWYSGLLHPIVVCQFENENRVYSNPNDHFENCRILSTDIRKQKHQEFDIKVFPNPFGDKLTINFPDAISRQISLVDIHGRILFTQMNPGNNLSINTSGLKTGIYFLQVQENNENLSFKICKE